MVLTWLDFDLTKIFSTFVFEKYVQMWLKAGSQQQAPPYHVKSFQKRWLLLGSAPYSMFVGAAPRVTRSVALGTLVSSLSKIWNMAFLIALGPTLFEPVGLSVKQWQTNNVVYCSFVYVHIRHILSDLESGPAVANCNLDKPASSLPRVHEEGPKQIN